MPAHVRVAEEPDGKAKLFGCTDGNDENLVLDTRSRAKVVSTSSMSDDGVRIVEVMNQSQNNTMAADNRVTFSTLCLSLETFSVGATAISTSQDDIVYVFQLCTCQSRCGQVYVRRLPPWLFSEFGSRTCQRRWRVFRNAPDVSGTPELGEVQSCPSTNDTEKVESVTCSRGCRNPHGHAVRKSDTGDVRAVNKKMIDITTFARCHCKSGKLL